MAAHALAIRSGELSPIEENVVALTTRVSSTDEGSGKPGRGSDVNR